MKSKKIKCVLSWRLRLSWAWLAMTDPSTTEHGIYIILNSCINHILRRLSKSTSSSKPGRLLWKPKYLFPAVKYIKSRQMIADHPTPSTKYLMMSYIPWHVGSPHQRNAHRRYKVSRPRKVYILPDVQYNTRRCITASRLIEEPPQITMSG